MTYGETIVVQTEGFSDIVCMDPEVGSVIQASGVSSGIVTVTVIGSTASITTIEFEPALVEDMKEFLNEILPESRRSRHSETWGDDNGFSHMRGSLMGPGVSLPVVNGKLLTGTWQQIVLVDHDNRARQRKVRVQVVGE